MIETLKGEMMTLLPSESPLRLALDVQLSWRSCGAGIETFGDDGYRRSFAPLMAAPG